MIMTIRLDSYLQLESPGVDLNDPGQFAQAQHSTIGQVTDADPAHKRNQVMFTKWKHLNVPDQDQFVGVVVEDASGHGLFNRVLVSCEIINSWQWASAAWLHALPTFSKKGHGLGSSLGRVLKTLSGWIFTPQGSQQGLIGRGQWLHVMAFILLGGVQSGWHDDDGLFDYQLISKMMNFFLSQTNCHNVSCVW